jgi:triacylglycerol lipase
MAAPFSIDGVRAMNEAAVAPLSAAVGADRLAYLKAGQGPAVVIIHGVGGHKEDWQGVMKALAASHTVYALDMLGFGGSSRDAKELGMAAQARAVAALLDVEKIERADLVGNSVGGWVAATFAAQYPDRTRKLVVVDPAGFDAMFKGESPVNLFPDDVQQMKALLTHVLASDFAHTVAFAATAFADLQASGEKALPPRLMPALFGSERLEAVMPKIKSPTLVLWGEKDGLFPVALAPYVASLTPGAKSATIPDASHFPHVDNPQAFTAAVAAFIAP